MSETGRIQVCRLADGGCLVYLHSQFVELLDEISATIRINLADALNVTEEESLRNKASQRCLIDGRRMLVHDRAHLYE